MTPRSNIVVMPPPPSKIIRRVLGGWMASLFVMSALSAQESLPAGVSEIPPPVIASPDLKNVKAFIDQLEMDSLEPLPLA